MKIKAFLTTLAIAAASISGIARADTILVFGDRSERNQLTADLTSLGHTVTNVATMPVDISVFDTVWTVQIFSAFTSAEKNRLASFINSGGGVHFTGERPCCETANDSIQDILNGVVAGGGIQVGDLGDTSSPYVFNSGAAGGITAGLTTWTPSATGAITGISGDNILVTGGGGAIVGGVWDSTDMTLGYGRATLLMDVNWFFNGGSRVQQISNIQTFLAGGQAPGDVPEPATIALLGLGFAGLGLRRRR